MLEAERLSFEAERARFQEYRALDTIDEASPTGAQQNAKHVNFEVQQQPAPIMSQTNTTNAELDNSVKSSRGFGTLLRAQGSALRKVDVPPTVRRKAKQKQIGKTPLTSIFEDALALRRKSLNEDDVQEDEHAEEDESSE